MSIAKEVGKRGIPVIGLDLPGHGRATRNPEGLETFKKQADWLMKAVKQLVDPQVKIVLSGHSWGGSFALFMHRLSRDPNYSRISQYISLSPPIDVSLGGSLKEKLEFEQRYQQEFEQFKAQIAPADFEFQSNLLNNGKDSDVGAYFTNLTDLDFQTPPLSPEEQSQLKKLTVVVGSADGLVYVGREKQFLAALGGLTGQNEFHLLGPGRTWKSNQTQDLLPTGHNIFDRYLDGTTTLEVYKLIGDKVLDGAATLDTNESTGQANLDLIERAFRHYANFFGFREMLRGRVEYVQSDTEHRSTISKRKGELEEYIRRVETLEADLAKIEDGRVVPPSVVKAVEQLRERLGITEQINVGRAREELSMKPVTPERKAALDKYIAEVQAADREMRANYRDTQFEEDIAELNTEYRGLLSDLSLSDVSEYKPKFDEYSRTKENNGERARIRSLLSRLHQRMMDLSKRRESRFGVARDAHLASIRTPPGVRDQRAAQRELAADHSPDRRAKLQAFVSEADVVEAAAKQSAIEELRGRIAAQPRPAGLSTPTEARALRDELDSYLNFTYAPADQPEVARLVPEIRTATKEVDDLFLGEGRNLSLDKLEASVKTLRVKRAGMLKNWDNLWKGGSLTSPNVAKSARGVNSTLANYKSLYFAYESQKSDYLLELKQSGRLTAANILALTPEIKELRRKVQRAKQVFADNRTELDTIRWVEALSGRLEGPADLVAKAADLAKALWGPEFVRTRRAGPNSLTLNLRVEEEYLANRQEQFMEREMELNELRTKYTQLMLAANQRIPFRVQRVELGALFNQPLATVINELNTKPAVAAALSQMLARWESYQARLRTESQSKDTSTY